MKLSDYIVEFLKGHGVTTIFGYQGGAITHFVDSIYEADGIKFISNYHEQASAFAAEGYARVSGNIGVCTATSGPGATNLITGIGSAFFDSIPCLYLAGQVNTYEYKRSKEIRQEGFQETDIVSIIKPITKYSVMVTKPEKIKYYLEKAFYVAKEGRPGPVLLDMPMDVQRAEINPDELIGFYESEEYKSKIIQKVKVKDVNDLINLIKNSKRPVILVGGGIRLSKAEKKLEEFIDITGIPVVCTLMGIDCVNHEHKCFVGYMGSYGNRYSNLAVANCDLLIVLGSRLTTRQTSSITDSFAREAKIVHVDIDKTELNIKVKEYLSIECDLNLFIDKLNKDLVDSNLKFDFSSWIDKLKIYKKKYPSYETYKDINQINPNEFMNTISEMLHPNSIICLDIGQNQIWASQSLKLSKDQRLLNAGGMGPMGFGVPSAIGAFYARPNSKIVVITGDGGIQMNIQELQTIAREKIPIKIIIMNNHSLGMIRHFQEMYFESNYYGTIDGYSVPDFIKISEAYGIKSLKISEQNQINELKEKLNDDESYIIDVELKGMTYVIPKLGMGRPIEDQEPLISREELKENMIIDIYKP
ncbi:biosynthetic-type acetolactate synthase large subunit [Clostridium estertheticum]|uniref:biosynthetic-type acetolactate synthase large subunit n=1 Tax=Clostridium estertheticum TaxID=238834 RepID=UPI001C0E0B32|nr:biosynthetic-type acetolactate synthase large subunit [Clostridium estertheticum]MBU3174467.1 biosynthetic-type acetolactate synthase large subunit [Clostridium estertheticum]